MLPLIITSGLVCSTSIPIYHIPSHSIPSFSILKYCIIIGDFGFIHENNLFINGRLKDLIIIRGKSIIYQCIYQQNLILWLKDIFPQDIELLAEQSHAKIKPGCIGAFSTEVANGRIQKKTIHYLFNGNYYCRGTYCYCSWG